MQADEQLIRKYQQGQCNPEETQALIAWLKEAQPDAAAEVPEMAPGLKAQMWQAIRQQVDRKKRHTRYLRFSGLAAAACIAALVLLIRSQQFLFPLSTELRNDGPMTRIVRLDNLQLSMPPGSNCRITTPLCGSEATIQFCGAISVSAYSDALTLKVTTGSGCYGSDQVKLQRGQTYMAMTDEQNNLIAATKQEWEDGIPQPFSHRLAKRFQL